MAIQTDPPSFDPDLIREESRKAARLAHRANIIATIAIIIATISIITTIVIAVVFNK
jgi:hypothetical protein